MNFICSASDIFKKKKQPELPEPGSSKSSELVCSSHKIIATWFYVSKRQ